MKRIKRNDILNITFYIISFTMYSFISLLLYLSLYRVHPYYLFILIPLVFLFTILSWNQLIKKILTLIILMFRNGGNYTSEEKVYLAIDKVNSITKYILIAVFITLLVSIMILDITYCLIKDEITLLSLSIVVWFLIGYFLYDYISYKFRKKIRE